MPQWKFLMGGAAGLSAAVLALSQVGANAHGGNEHHGNHVPSTQAVAAAPGGVFLLASDLKGANEVPGPGDPDGSGRVTVRIQGNVVCFTLEWSKLSTVTAAHIHVGAAGVGGGVRVGFFNGALADSFTAVNGCVTGDQAVIDAIVADPAGYYANIHTTEYPAGAIRSQLRALDTAVDLLRPFRGPKVALMDGMQEVPALGDLDGRAVGFVTLGSTRVSWAFTWSAIGPPAAGHIHTGKVGVPGPVVVGLFAAAAPIPASIQAAAGMVPSQGAVTNPIRRNPQNYYLNLHNADFPAGAVRGQLFNA
ncbi:MAG TPA: CHRD domain-containing protein [Pilimelia sp.]|nr:CHRD domain-containing protein [Pilimelia sp.]